MATEHTRWSGRLRGPFAMLSHLGRLGDLPVVMMLVWAGWLAVPWSFSGLTQARAAAAAAAANAGPPPVRLPAPGIHHQAPPADSPGTGALGPAARTGPVRHGAPAEFVRQGPAGQTAWGLPAATDQGGQRLRTMLAAHPGPTGDTLERSRPDSIRTGSLSPESTLAGSAPGGGLVDGARAGAWVDAVASERARIAGEVHDVAGHGLAAIAMQAGLALVTLDDDPEQARASLRAIRETSTLALAQLRAALDGIDPPGGDLAGLIDGVRAAGLPVDVEPAGVAPADLAVPAPLQDIVYRVVRESLTNVLRHAGPTRALVRVGGDPPEFVLEVADRGAGRTGAAEGRGLAGMRARVVEAGGRFAAGPRQGGGFRVVARFPRVSA
ncbi:histidine kinase [Nonomuraea sp. B12E4]|uniref:sensor histidine kinase n=1 Tax=Nonomuraea sp. B12E4 TaxID=3153564 RepID=UPI00325F06BD